MKRYVVMSVLAAGIGCFADCAAQCDDAFLIGVSGFSEAVCNEKGVREVKEFGADFVRCVKISNRETLDLLAKYGVKAVVKGVVPSWWGGKTELAGLMHEKRPLSAYAKAKKKYVPHPAIMAVDIGDEPSKSDFAHYAKVVKYLNGELPGVTFTLNLFPSYGSHIARTPEERLKQLGTASYQDYVRSYCEMFPTMKELSSDFYPYSAPPKEVDAYILRRLADLSVLSRASREYGKRLVLTMQANSLFPELEMDLPRLRYQAFTALAFGVRRAIWVCYTPSWWENNILEKDGSKTPRYDRVRTVNAELHALARDFARFRQIGTRFDGFSADERKALGDAPDVRWRDFTAIRKISCDGKLVVGEFVSKDGSGDTAVMVAAAWDPEGKVSGAKRLRFRANGTVRVYGPKGEVMPVREHDGKYALDLASDGAFFIVGGVPPEVPFLKVNPADQQRRFNPASDETLPLFADMGFNAFSAGGILKCDFTTDDPKWSEGLADVARERSKFIGEHGAAAFFPLSYGRDKNLSTRYSRIDINGRKVPGKGSSKYELDAAVPEAREAAVRAMRKVAKSIGTDENFCGMRPCGEIRLRTTPSFTERNAATYRADTGRAVPPEAQGRAAPHWSTLKDIPPDRIVSEHHPILEFYRWFWQKGDGWNGFGDAMVEAFYDETGGRRVLTEYEPCLRTPPLFGCGGDMEMVGHWFYCYNDSPINVSFDLAHISEIARGTPGQQTIVGLQCICHLRRIANRANIKTDAPIPEWYAVRDKLLETAPKGVEYYPSTPPDMMRIGLWSAMSRRFDAISFHGWQCVFDPAVYKDKFAKVNKGMDPRVVGYQYTNPGLKVALEDFMRDVAVPYGPLFKAVPERKPEVAVFLGWASAILSGTAYIDWNRPHLCGVVAAAASLSPSVLLEEDVEMNGVPESVKVLLMPEADVLTEGAYVRIRDFQRKGGKLIAFDTLAPALKADALLPKFCEPPPKRGPADQFEKDFRSAVVEMQRTVAAYVKPRVTTDNPHICAHARGEKAYDLVFVVNDRRGPGEYAGVFNTVLDKGLPTEGTVTLARNAKAVYDLLTHKRVDCEARDGAISIPLSLGGAEGRVFLVCERALAPLSVVVKRVNGQDVRCLRGIEVTVTSPDKDVMVPIRVDGAGKKPFYGVVKCGTWRHVFKDVADVRVTNLADGNQTTKTQMQ